MELDLNFAQLSFPVYINADITGHQCNLNCSYCQYPTAGAYNPDREMGYETLEHFTRLYNDAQIHSGIKFIWQGGEPLLRGISFFREAVRYQQEICTKKKIANVLYTNGTLIDQEWIRLFKENNFYIYISLDGPAHCHNHYRVTQDGKDSYDQVMHAITLLKTSGIRHTVVCNVNDYNVKYPLELYRFFKTHDIRNIQFKPVVYKKNGSIARSSVILQSYGSFLCEIFDEWIRHDIGMFNISIFENTLKKFCGKESVNCQWTATCGHNATIDYLGNIYSCHRFIGPENAIGNIYSQSITNIVYGRKQIRFGQSKRNNLTVQCKKCKFLRLCNGGCIKDRIGSSISGEKGHNILCKDLIKFYSHVSPAMTFMAEEIAGGGVPSRIMTFFDHK